MRYLPPIRLYLVVSVFFFLLLALLPGSSDQAVDIEQDSLQCAELQYKGPLPQLVGPRLRLACERVTADGGSALSEAFLRNTPKAMFVLLPLFALLMMPFYWRPRRLYAEHAIFLIHTHTACFAVLALAMLISLALPERVGDGLPLVVTGYLLWAVFSGMKTYYGGSRASVALKFGLLGFLYLTLAGVVLAFTGLASLLEVLISSV